MGGLPLLALAVIYDGGARQDAARVGGVGSQTVRDRVCSSMPKAPTACPTACRTARHPAPGPELGPEHKRALAGVTRQGPIPASHGAASHGVVRWRIVDLIQWLFDEHGVSVSKQTLSRDMRAMGYRKLTARRGTCPGIRRKTRARLRILKKTSPPSWSKSGRVLAQEHP